MSAIPDNPDTLLTTAQLAAALTEAGFPISAATLNTRVTRPGRYGSPPYRKFSTKRLYSWRLAQEWAEACLGPLATTAAEARQLSAASSADAAA